MKASAFVEHVRSRFDARLVARGERLLVSGCLPPHVKAAIARHKAQLLAFLVNASDDDLRVTDSPAELGLIRMDNGRWAHPEGDEIGERALVGLIDPDEISARIEHGRKEALSLGMKLPPPREEDVEDLREVSPGVWRWAERRGHRYKKPFPKVSRT